MVQLSFTYGLSTPTQSYEARSCLLPPVLLRLVVHLPHHTCLLLWCRVALSGCLTAWAALALTSHGGE